MEPKAGRPHSPVLTAEAGTEYSGPVVVTTLELSGRSIRLARPADPDRLLDDPVVIDWNRRDDYMPYWAYLWPAAFLLADAVAREHWPLPTADSRAPKVLEIGCGLGLAGLVALARGLFVQFTDYDPAPLEFVVRSAAENGFDPTRFAIRRLDWRALPDERFSLILGADVIYEAPLVPLVANLLGTLLAEGGLGLIASPYRAAAHAFPAALASIGLACRAEPATSQTESGRSIMGTVYRVTRAGSCFAARSD
jgi:predicted nicotinamide N-methyase